MSSSYVIEHPFLKPARDVSSPFAGIPREWDWVLDDPRRRQELQLRLFPGMRDYHAASDAQLVARRGRSTVGATPPGYVPHARLQLALPDAARASASRRLNGDGPWIALMPAGSGERALYPSAASWELIVDALQGAPGRAISSSPRTPVRPRRARRRDAVADALGRALVRVLRQPRPVPLVRARAARVLPGLLHAQRGDAAAIWSLDGVHARYLTG